VTRKKKAVAQAPRRYEVQMLPDDALEFGLYLRGLAATMRPDATIAMDWALEDSGVPYTKHYLENE
jgi:hypothetical protein